MFKNLSLVGHGKEYVDRTLIDLAAASIYFERSGNHRNRGRVENNLASLYSTIGQFTEAHECLDRSRNLFFDLGDRGPTAQVDDTRAMVLLAEGRNAEAETVSGAAAATLSDGDDSSLLAEALRTYGTALARTGKHRESRVALQAAIQLAESWGDHEAAARGRLRLVEELGRILPTRELVTNYKAAAEVLRYSQDPAATAKLISAADRVIDALPRSAIPSGNRFPLSEESAFSLKHEMQVYEGRMIHEALQQADGSVTQAARLLGFKSHRCWPGSISTPN